MKGIKMEWYDGFYEAWQVALTPRSKLSKSENRRKILIHDGMSFSRDCKTGFDFFTYS